MGNISGGRYMMTPRLSKRLKGTTSRSQRFSDDFEVNIYNYSLKQLDLKS